MKWLDRLLAVLFVGWLMLSANGYEQLGAAFEGLLEQAQKFEEKLKTILKKNIR